MTRTYTYTSQPHSAPKTKGGTTITHIPPNNENNVGTENSVFVPLSLMSDPRVVRGNTQELARKVAISRAQREEQEKQQQLLLSRQLRLKQKIESDTSRHNPPTGAMYNFTVRSYAQDDVEINKFLQEAEDLGPQKREISTEIDALLPRPITPKYVPRKTGKDQSTQVEDVTELFHFDAEVQPMLETIVQKTIEQALLEVQAESELIALRYQIELFEAQKAKEEAWTKNHLEKLQIESRKIEDQKKNILFKKKKEVRLKTTVAGLQMMRQIAPSMEEHIARRQYEKKKWKTSDVKEFERKTIPNEIVPNVHRRVEQYYTARDMLDELILESDQKAASLAPARSRSRSPVHKKK